MYKQTCNRYTSSQFNSRAIIVIVTDIEVRNTKDTIFQGCQG